MPIGNNFQEFAFTMLTNAIEDYHRGCQEDCLSFLDTDVFLLCCSVLDADEKRVREWMLRRYKKKRTLPKICKEAYR